MLDCVYVCVHACMCVFQGVVCTLHEGDDFGKLALVTDSPRAASIVLREDNCHFLRVDKEDFNRILRVGRQEVDNCQVVSHKHQIITVISTGFTESLLSQHSLT